MVEDDGIIDCRSQIGSAYAPRHFGSVFGIVPADFTQEQLGINVLAESTDAEISASQTVELCGCHHRSTSAGITKNYGSTNGQRLECATSFGEHQIVIRQ